METINTIHETSTGSTARGAGEPKGEVNKHLKKLIDFIVGRYQAVMQLRDTPHSIAGGVGIGIFYGFIPLFIPFVPIKTVLTFLSTLLARCNKTAAVIAVTAHDVIFPIWPLVLRWEYQIGYWLLHHEMPPRLHSEHHHFSIDFRFEHWFSMETFHGWSQWVRDNVNWKFFARILGPTLLGSVVIAIPVAIICYAIALRIVRQYQAIREEKEKAAAQSEG